MTTPARGGWPVTALAERRPQSLCGLPGLTPQGVIFDMDGVLLDSEPLHHHAVNAVLLEDGLPPLSLAEYTRYLGTTDEDMWRDLRTTRGLGQRHEHYLKRFDEHVLALIFHGAETPV